LNPGSGDLRWFCRFPRRSFWRFAWRPELLLASLPRALGPVGKPMPAPLGKRRAAIVCARAGDLPPAARLPRTSTGACQNIVPYP